VKRPPLYTLLELTFFRVWFKRLYRIDVTNPERIPKQGPVILVANHESLIDPWILGIATPRPIRYMAKAELWNYPVLRTIMRWFGTFPVTRGVGDREAVGYATDLLAHDQVLGMFPQGTCLPYRRRPWLRGAARLALSTGTSIVPVCIVGSERALRPGKFKMGLPRIRVFVGELIEVPQARPTVAASKELTTRVEQSIEAARAPFGPPAHAWYADDATPKSKVA
jgi:1-acyl-sn-glycerol-3-phosphate acyltransferase